MFKKIIEESIQFISNNTKVIRLAFITSFFHSLTILALIANNINNLIKTKFNEGISYNTLIDYIKHERWLIIVIIIIWAIWYEFIYPIWQAALIYFIKSWWKKIWNAISKWVENFFIMFELNNLVTIFAGTTFLMTILRFWTLEIAWNTFIMIILWIRFFFVVFAWIFRPYIAYVINLENMNLYDAMKRSVNLSIHNFWITLRFVLLQMVLLFRFIINIAIVLWIPIFLVFLASSLNILWKITNSIIIATLIFLVIGTAYINGIIEAFFTTYRYKVYERIIAKENEED